MTSVSFLHVQLMPAGTAGIACWTLDARVKTQPAPTI